MKRGPFWQRPLLVCLIVLGSGVYGWGKMEVLWDLTILGGGPEPSFPWMFCFLGCF